MNRLFVLSAVVALSLAAIPLSRAQSGSMKGMDMKGMDMMGKDKKDKGADNKSEGKSHKGVGTVNNVDAKTGKVNLSHGPIQTLKWPAMTMDFTVKDKAMLDKLTTGKKVEFEFVQQGKDYVITSVK